MHLTQHWTGRWKTRERPIRQTSRGKPPKQNTIERTTIMAAGGSPPDFSSGASYVDVRYWHLADFARLSLNDRNSVRWP